MLPARGSEPTGLLTGPSSRRSPPSGKMSSSGIQALITSGVGRRCIEIGDELRDEVEAEEDVECSDGRRGHDG